MKYLFIIRMLLGSLLPVVINGYFKADRESAYKLKSLSKILILFFLLILISMLIINLMSFELITSFWIGKILTVIIAVIIIYFIPRAIPGINVMNLLVSARLPANKENFKFNLFLLFFCMYKSSSIYLGISRSPEQLMKNVDLFSLLVIYANYSIIVMLLLILIEIIMITSEELLFRYVSINALNSVLNNKRTAILVSSLIWILMHRIFSLELFVIGTILGYFYITSGSLLIPIMFHLLSNVATYTMPFYIHYGRDYISPLQYVIGLFAILLLSGFLLRYLSLMKKPVNISFQ